MQQLETLLMRGTETVFSMKHVQWHWTERVELLFSSILGRKGWSCLCCPGIEEEPNWFTILISFLFPPLHLGMGKKELTVPAVFLAQFVPPCLLATLFSSLPAPSPVAFLGIGNGRSVVAHSPSHSWEGLHRQIVQELSALLLSCMATLDGSKQR